MKRDEKPTPTDTATLTIAEVGRHLRRSKAWSYLAAKDGRIPCIETIAGRRVRREDFERLVGISNTTPHVPANTETVVPLERSTAS